MFVVTPGADWAYALSSGLQQRTLPAVAGLLSGHLLAVAVVAAGVGAFVASAPGVLTVLTVVGSLYLVYLGVMTLRRPATVRADDGTSGTAWRWYGRGVGVSGLNPKVFLLFLAVLPPFVDATATWPSAAQIVTLGAVHVLTCAVVYVAVGVASHALLQSRPIAARVVSRVSGAAMIGIGLLLLIERLVHLP